MADEMKVVIGADVSQGVAGINRFNEAMAKVKPGTQSATFALTNLGRVAQDLPFGFIGIANNLNPLLESFQRLKAETGSSKAALSALVGSLTGAGGLGLALSLVTAAISFISVGFSAWTRGMGTNKDEVDKHTKAVEIAATAWEKYLEKLNETIKAMSQESAKVQILFGALGDTNLKLEERKSIISELNAISGKYLGHLDAEKSSYIEISKAVEDYLNNVAQATELKALLPEFEKIVQKMVAAQVQLNQISRERKIAQGLGLFSAEDEREFQQQVQTLTSQIRGAGNSIKVAKEVMNDIAGGPLALEELLFGKKDQKLDKPKLEKDFDKIRHAIMFSRQELEAFQKTLDIVNGVKQPTKPSFRDKAPSTVPLLNINEKNFFTPLTKAEQAFADFKENLEKQITDLRVNLTAGFAEAIGTLAGGGGLKNAIGGFLSLVATALEAIGKAAITAGLATEAVKKALQSLFLSPMALVAAGAAAIAAGAFIRAKIPKFAEGGVVTKPTLGLFGEAGPEAVIPLNKFGQMGGGMPAFVELRLKGRDAVGLIELNKRSLNRIS